MALGVIAGSAFRFPAAVAPETCKIGRMCGYCFVDAGEDAEAPSSGLR